MKTVGEILKTARVKKNISLEKIAGYTKIHLRYLEAIENNQFSKLPPAAFTKGFLRTYADLVQADRQTVLAVFRRDYDQDERGRIIPRSMLHPVKPAAHGLTPNLLTLISVAAAAVVIAAFFSWQLIQFSAAPKLELNEPAENSVLISPVYVRGSTDPMASLTINNRPVIVDASGDFATHIDLTPGQHTLILLTSGRSGKKNALERIIYIEAVPTSTD